MYALADSGWLFFDLDQIGLSQYRPLVLQDGHSQESDTVRSLAAMRHDPEAIAHAFESGEYPYHAKLKRAVYEKNKAAFQVELLKVQPTDVDRPPSPNYS